MCSWPWVTHEVAKVGYKSKKRYKRLLSNRVQDPALPPPQAGWPWKAEPGGAEEGRGRPTSARGGGGREVLGPIPVDCCSSDALLSTSDGAQPCPAYGGGQHCNRSGEAASSRRDQPEPRPKALLRGGGRQVRQGGPLAAPPGGTLGTALPQSLPRPQPAACPPWKGISADALSVQFLGGRRGQGHFWERVEEEPLSPPSLWRGSPKAGVAGHVPAGGNYPATRPKA